jgi:hypothetical protein
MSSPYCIAQRPLGRRRTVVTNRAITARHVIAFSTIVPKDHLIALVVVPVVHVHLPYWVIIPPMVAAV